MKIILADISVSMCDAFERHCGDIPDVEIHRGSILDVDADMFVSPANSFGFMNGGIDAVYTRHFGPHLQENLQKEIKREFHGELPVGQAALVWNRKDGEAPTTTKFSCMIAAPTMRVPTILPMDTIAPYLATRAALIVAKDLVDHSKLRPIIAFPGMGTGIGDVRPDLCAKQVRTAIQRIVLGGSAFPKTLGMAYDVPTDVEGD